MKTERLSCFVTQKKGAVASARAGAEGALLGGYEAEEEENVPAVAGRGLQGRAQPGAWKRFCWRRKEAPRTQHGLPRTA